MNASSRRRRATRGILLQKTYAQELGEVTGQFLIVDLFILAAWDIHLNTEDGTHAEEDDQVMMRKETAGDYCMAVNIFNGRDRPPT